MSLVSDWPDNVYSTYTRAKFRGDRLSIIQVTKNDTLEGSETTTMGFPLADAIRRIKGILFEVRQSKVKEWELFGGALDEADIDHGDSYTTITLFGKYAVVSHWQLHAFWGPPNTSGLPSNLDPNREGPYKPSRQYLLFERGEEGIYTLKDKQFDELNGAPEGDETFWSNFDFYNSRVSPNSSRSSDTRKATTHYSRDGKTVTSYIVMSNTYYYWRDDTPVKEGYEPNIKGDFHTLTPYIVRRDLSQGLLPVQIKQQLFPFSQNFNGEKEYWSPNHIFEGALTPIYDEFPPLNGFSGHEGLIAMDQDSVHMTTYRRTRASGIEPTADLFIEMGFSSILIETGAETIHDTWTFNHDEAFKGGAKTIFELMQTQPIGDTNVLGWVEGNFGSNLLKFYAAPQKQGMGAGVLKFTIETPHAIFRSVDETTPGNYREGFYVDFWSVNNAVSWEDDEGNFEDKQIYGAVVATHDVAEGGDPDPPGTISVYKSEGGAEPELVKEYTQHIGFLSRGLHVRTSGKWVVLYLAGLDPSEEDSIPLIWKAVNLLTGDEEDVQEGLTESLNELNQERIENNEEPIESFSTLSTTTFEIR